jgi:hypothetical protein
VKLDVSPYVEDRFKLKNIDIVLPIFQLSTFSKKVLHLQDRVRQDISSELESYYKEAYSRRQNGNTMRISMDRVYENMIQEKICLILKGRKMKHL